MKNILSTIHSPDDIKSLSIKQLKQLAGEIRDFLIRNVTKTGGHLAPNLGVVELTLALHYVFNLPKDSVLWDVGHQSYVHKILTGRKELFSTLRKKEGLSGFPSPQESPYDCFHSGHASTALSVAAGITHAKALKNEHSATIAVIGDGSFTGGSIYEALNDITWRNLPLIIILNDNKMSISENVGGISRHLDRLRANPWYLSAKKRIYRFLECLPLGKYLAKTIYHLKLGLKKLFFRRHSLFETLGLRYMGPFDGHDLSTLITLFQHIKEDQSPILLHVLTKKGLGYKKSEKNPVAFHGISGQDDSISIPGKSFSSSFGETLCSLAKRDPRIVAITAAMREGTGLGTFAKEFPSRFVDTGIAEAHAVASAAGLAVEGYRPIVAIYSTFLQRAYDQCIHEVGIAGLPVIFALDRSGLVPGDGKTHQGIFDISYLRSIPNFIIFAPINAQELQMSLEFGLTLNQPFAVRYPKSTVPLQDFSLPPIVLGEGFFLRQGDKGVIAFLGTPIEGLFDKKWENWALYHIRFAKPIAQKTIKDLSSYQRVIIIEEGIENGGIGVAIQQELYTQHPSIEVFLKNIPDEFPDVDSRDGLLAHYGFAPLQIEGLQ